MIELEVSGQRGRRVVGVGTQNSSGPSNEKKESTPHFLTLHVSAERNRSVTRRGSARDHGVSSEAPRAKWESTERRKNGRRDRISP